MGGGDGGSRHRVLIVGGGFGGLCAAKALRHAPVQLTIVDRRRYRLFQPLLCQVAAGSLSPDDITSPLRDVLVNKNTRAIPGEVVDIDPFGRHVALPDGQQIPYDTLVLAAGSGPHYFGNDHWMRYAPALKTLEGALDVHRRVLLAFESAEREPDPQKRRAWMTFVIVGGGPTGVELAGALAESARSTIRGRFRVADPRDAKIVLLEMLDRVLPTGYAPEVSARAEAALRRLGVVVRTGTRVMDITETAVTVGRNNALQRIEARTTLWAAGVRASPLGATLAARTGVALDRNGRVVVEPDLSVPGHPSIFVVGDLAHVAHERDRAPLPGLASIAMREGTYVGDAIKRRLTGKEAAPFRYRSRGTFVVIGRNRAVADLPFGALSGVPAWVIWALVHIMYLVEFDGKPSVLLQWAVRRLTQKRDARPIAGEQPRLEIRQE